MATFTPLLRPDKVRPDGRAPIYLAVRAEGVKRMVALGVHVRPRDWNKARHEVRKTEAEFSRYNDLLAKVMSAANAAHAERVAHRLPASSADLVEDVRAWLGDVPEATPEPTDFLAFMNDWVEGFSERGQPETHNAYRTAYRRLKAYAEKVAGPGGKLPFERLTAPLLRRWGQSMAAKPPHGEGLKQNTVRKLLTSVRTAARAALRDGVAPDGWRDPFERLQGDPLLRTERVTKGRLTLDQVNAIAAAEAEPGSLVQAVRDAFVFAFFAGGMRWGDVALLRWENVDRAENGQPVRLEYEAEKTGKRTVVPVLPDAAVILARYAPRASGPTQMPHVFPFLDGRDLSTPARRRAAVASRGAYANKVLKKLAARADVKQPVTFHIARHSLAAHLLESDVSPFIIKEVLRHSSVQTTERYLRSFDDELVERAYLGAFGSDV